MVGAETERSRHLWEGAYPAGVDWNIAIDSKPLFSLVDDAARQFATRPAIDFLDKRYSYAELARMVDRVAAGLQAAGVEKGTRVGLFLPNCPYTVFLFFGVLKAGGIVVNYNPLYADQELKKQVADSGTEIMATLDLNATYPKVKALLDDGVLKRALICPMADILPFPKNLLFPIAKRAERATIGYDKRHLRWAEIINAGPAPRPVTIQSSDVAVLQYTGGTTGIPKGAMLTHGSLYANTCQSYAWFKDMRPGEEKVLGVLPLFHVFAMTSVMTMGIKGGAEMILLPRFEIDQVLATIDKKRPTLVPGVPTMYTAINNHPRLKEYDLSSIRFCNSGGAPLPIEVKKRFEELTGCVLVEGYGLTESSPVATVNPLDGRAKPGSIGLPVPGTIIEVRDPADPDRVMPRGEKGEICISGPQVMAGYWNKPEETAKTLRGGRLHTGDVGYFDEEGFIFLVDRIKDLILAGGYNVYPRVVEEAIYQHPDVAEVTVIGVPDAYRGETVKAFIVPKPGKALTADALKAFLKDKLSPIEMPKLIEFRDSLPKTMVGKLSKKELVAEEKMKAEQARGAAAE